MNKKQKNVLWTSLAIFILMGLFPPWAIRHKTGIMVYQTYNFIINDLAPGFNVHYSRLWSQWILVVVVGGILFLLLKDKNE